MVHTVTQTHSDVELLQCKQLMIHLDGPQQLFRAVHQLQGTFRVKNKMKLNMNVQLLLFMLCRTHGCSEVSAARLTNVCETTAPTSLSVLSLSVSCSP